jgi:hypothetical protein
LVSTLDPDNLTDYGNGIVLLKKSPQTGGAFSTAKLPYFFGSILMLF